MNFFILSLIVGAAWARGTVPPQAIVPGHCPSFNPMTDFTVEYYLGKWYEIARFPMPYETGQTCNYAEYSDRGDGTAGVHNAGLDANGNLVEIFGFVEPTSQQGTLALHLEGVPFVGTYNVLDTDYDSYAAVYSCQEFLGVGHIDQAWILGREKTLTLEEMVVALNAFDTWGIDTKKFIKTMQEPCEFPQE
ncbi:apolipoprotein D-like [Macrobrachium nipponense]|uniref:apolipoprotein D-like n=1 Tax=Macrobrachium nipponense TaxID=159736 RepID=UPI0030C82F11